MGVEVRNMVDTKKATRRLLRFETIDDVLADIDQLVAAAHAGTLQQLGNWKPGQVFAHVAAWIEYGYDGYPMKTSWFIRMLLRMMLPGLLKNGLKPGAKIPGVPGGTTGQDDQPIDEAAQRLKKAFLRLKSDEHCPYDSPGFGAMSHADRIRLNLRHAELHMSFLKP